MYPVFSLFFSSITGRVSSAVRDRIIMRMRKAVLSHFGCAILFTECTLCESIGRNRTSHSRGQSGAFQSPVYYGYRFSIQLCSMCGHGNRRNCCYVTPEAARPQSGGCQKFWRENLLAPKKVRDGDATAAATLGQPHTPTPASCWTTHAAAYGAVDKGEHADQRPVGNKLQKDGVRQRGRDRHGARHRAGRAQEQGQGQGLPRPAGRLWPATAAGRQRPHRRDAALVRSKRGVP